jgi:hypothetical protein
LAEPSLLSLSSRRSLKRKRHRLTRNSARRPAPLQARRATGCRADQRSKTYFFFNDWDRYQSRGVLIFARYEGAHYTLVAINTSDVEQSVPFWFPIAGKYIEELHGGDLNLDNIPVLQEVALRIPSYYGRIWTAATP